MKSLTRRKGSRLAVGMLPALLLLAACGSSGSESAPSEAELVERARGIHERVITLDTHVDINAANFTMARNYTHDLPTQVTLPKMESGGLDAAFFIVYVGQGPLTAEGYRQAHASAIEKFDAIHRLTEEIAPERIGLALTSDDVRRIAGEGRRVALIGVENGYQLGTDLANLADFHARGARYISLAHNGHSQFSDSNTGESDGVFLHGGLSELGLQAVDEMNRLGIVIDISHPSKPSIMQTLERSRAPVIASHSSARALNDVSRNLDDEQLMAVRDNGGVVQAVAFRSYLNSAKHTAYQQALDALYADVASQMGFEILGRGAVLGLPADEREAYQARMDELRVRAEPRLAAEVYAVAPPVDVADLVDHIDYMVRLIGLEHVGISSDFDGGGGVEGWTDASETFNVTLELVRRGYDERQIEMLWSGNLLRVLDDVQRVAAEIQAGVGA
ncbi:MAG: dipeptidase [Thioalkalivibrio sp.]|nr:dipeptidase [Thioalkalivibrio sp.]